MGEASHSPRIRRAAWLVWITVAVIINGIVLFNMERSVTPNYRDAVWNWFAGKPLYNMKGSGFIYFPQAALVFAPWGLLPRSVGEVLWRLTIQAVLAAGVFRFTRLVTSDDRWFLVNSLVSAATAAGCLRNGQSTLIIAGLMLLASVDLSERRWWRATILLALAFAFKPVAIVLVLLVAAIFPQMLWRLLIGMIVVALAPFVTQHPDFVASQYVACYENSKIAFVIGETGHWAQLFGMLKVAGFDVPSPTQQGIRLTSAVATLIACWMAVKKLAPDRGIFYLYALSTCYLMLFNSRTEGSTYAMIAPVYGILLAEAWFGRRDWLATIGYWLAVIATIFNYDLAILVVRKPNEVWLCPFVCIIVTIDLLRRLGRELRSSNTPLGSST